MKFSNKFNFVLICFIMLIISVLITSNQFSSAINVDNDVQVAADTHKILLDSKAEIIYEIEQSGKIYYVIMYNNALPFASGLEVILKDGTLVSSSSQVKSIFTSAAWIEASKKLTSSDIETLNNILLTSNKINESISPVYSTTTSVIEKIDWLKTQCTEILFVKKCYWDIIKFAADSQLLGGSMILEQSVYVVRELNEELGEWDDASRDVNRNLSNTITGLEKLRSGGELNPTLEHDIEKSLSSFLTLKSKTNELANSLSGISTILSTTESSLESLSGTPFVGNEILDLAGFFGDLNSKVISLNNEAQSFSNTLTTQSKKLETVMSFAEVKTNELAVLWDARQNASSSVYAFIVGMIVVIATISGIVVIFSKKRKSSVSHVSVSGRKFCRKCGSSISKTAKFCGKCGNLS